MHILCHNISLVDNVCLASPVILNAVCKHHRNCLVMGFEPMIVGGFSNLSR